MFIDERERKRERCDVRGKHCLVASHLRPNRDGTHKLGMCPARGSNAQPFGAWDYTPTNSATQPEPKS